MQLRSALQHTYMRVQLDVRAMHRAKRVWLVQHGILSIGGFVFELHRNVQHFVVQQLHMRCGIRLRYRLRV